MGAKSQSEIDAFNRGYLLAVSNLMNLHDAEVEATDVLRELGLSRAATLRLGLTSYDIAALRPVWRNLERQK